jgi:GNAT superfamily N-acetyltransferase
LLKRLTCVDYVRRFALVARSAGRGVAVARYSALPSADDGTVTAEVAVAVAPEWRRVGLATALMDQLARRAQECGITHFRALFSATNRPVAALAHEIHARVVIADGAAELDALLETPHDAPQPVRLPVPETTA